MPKTDDIISEYEAATITMMSPTLLKWLTSHAPKSGVSRKLKIARTEKDRTFYDRKEVAAFDSWLKQPWPRKDGKRPSIPSAIRKEIRVEANGACVICHGHKDTCEAAHIDPVAKTDNNHPENLVWLCSNHHTAYDKGLFGPKVGEADFVASLKEVLRRYKVMQWRMQADLAITALTALENCALLRKQLAAAKTEEQIKAVEVVAQDVLDKLPSLAPISTEDPRYAGYQAVRLKINKLARSRKPIRQRLTSASEVRQEYVAALGMVACPLCNATGKHAGEDCPVCCGDREVEKSDVAKINLDQFRYVTCSICEGDGLHDGEVCPACGGDGEMERRFADRVDPSDYSKVNCPVCDGSRKYLGDDCQACDAEGEMDRRHADQIDVGEYQIVDCPLCEGLGMYENSDCPECRGERTMQRRFADRVDVRDYTNVDCPVCKGKGKLRGDDCPACDGIGQFERRYLDRVDRREYDLVDCPVCKNKTKHGRDECSACNGEGEMERRFADQIDPQEYRRQ